ncbi:hypothetical protein [Solimonas sp. SE-A11]|uniref:hypothetical protein n=1 Tax=Solimonas sp. SE-A11 TaxID=3054954 RepID=UPI00259CAFB5|nr:hypothetical protein [Solimonas sp. SE-A11]MDM4772273.1 hypothetical protein [Solimonas sp. SE-A11]
MSARLFAALIALAASAPLSAAGTADAPETAVAAPAEPATGPALAPEEAPAPPEAPAAEAPSTAGTAPEAAPSPAAEPSTAAAPERKLEGTKLLFLRMNLRIKLVEQELLSMSPDRLLEHMGVASDLLAQLRSRQLEDAEIARADSMEQYLQFLAESYVQLHTGKTPRKQKKARG